MAQGILNKIISRKMFMKVCVSGLAAMYAGGALSRLARAQSESSKGRTKRPVKTDADLVVIKGEDPYVMTKKSIEAIGGMSRFVKKGDTVAIKPNMGWDRAVEYAANTNPFVVAALAELCYAAGAKRVNVFDITCNSQQRCYENSGIKRAAEEKGAKVYFADDWNFVKAKFGYKSPMEGWPIYRDALECDTFINVPIVKNHGLTGLTLSMKNLMGVCGPDRGQIHSNIGQKLVDLTDFIKPDLTVIDAYRVLTANGPSGGSLDDVKLMKTLIAGTDPTLADVYACKLMEVDPRSISYISEAINRGFGKSDLASARIITLSA